MNFLRHAVLLAFLVSCASADPSAESLGEVSSAVGKGQEKKKDAGADADPDIDAGDAAPGACGSSTLIGVAYGTGSTACGPDSFASGRNVHATGETSTVFGDDCTSDYGSYRSLVAGHSSHTSAPDTITLGEHSTTTADGAVAIGYTASSSASWGIALGAYVTAGGRYSSARGLSVTTSRQGEDAHGSGHPGAQGFHALDLYAEAAGAVTALKVSDGSPFLLTNQTAHAMHVRILALTPDGSMMASEERSLLVRALPGPVVSVIGEQTIASPGGGLSPLGWSMSIEPADGLELRFAFNPGPNTVKVLVRLEWSQIAIPT